MDEHTKTKPARSPARVRPARRRRHERPEPPHGPRRIIDDVTPPAAPAAEELEPQPGGGGSSGRGPLDDDGDGRRPDRDGDARNLLIALGLIAVGATVMSARLLAKAGRQPHSV